LAIAAAPLAAYVACGGAASESSGFRKSSASFSDDVLPIFRQHCVSCHGDSGGLSLESYREIMQGRGSDPVVVPGNPDRSDLVDAVESSRMPKLIGFHKKLSEAELQAIRLWIIQGARDN
jgi:hypothetical protein